MSLVSEFREFIRRGNVIDLAVGVIMGAAFGSVVKSLVDDVLMPPIGYIIGGIEFSGIKIKLPVPIGEPVTINVGNFLQALINFLIIGFCVFLVVKAVNRLNRQEPPKPAEMTTSEKLLTEIRDLLKEPRP